MTLGTFLDAAYTSLVEEYIRLGTDMQSALKELELWRAGGPPGITVTTPILTSAEVTRSQEQAQAIQNEKSLAELQKMMASVRM